MKDHAGHAKVSSRIILYHTLRSCGQRLRTDQNWIRSFEQHVLAISSRLLPYPTLSSWNRPRMSVDDPGVLSVQFYPYLLTLSCMMFIDVWCNRYWSTQICQQCPRSKRWSWYGTTKEGKSFYGFEMFRRHDEWYIVTYSTARRVR